MNQLFYILKVSFSKLKYINAYQIYKCYFNLICSNNYDYFFEVKFVGDFEVGFAHLMKSLNVVHCSCSSHQL